MKTIKQAVMIFSILTVLLCGVYPLVVTVIGQTFFKFQTQGELLTHKGQVIGSELIGQEFKAEKYFRGRPSAAGYNPEVSSGSNYSLTNSDLKKAVSDRMAEGLDFDLLSSSASGLDPHISPDAALLQVNRVAAARSLKPEELIKLIRSNTENRQLGFLGEERVNVLKLNLDMENLAHE